MTSIRHVHSLPFDQTGLRHDMAKNIARLLRIVDAMGVDLEWGDLGETRRGEYRDRESGRYYDRRGLIVLHTGLRGFQVVTTLGHEIAHAMYGDTESNDTTEERACRVGAGIAIDPAHFRRTRIAGAKTFGVTPRALEDLGAAPHAESGCQCFPCQKFRERVLKEMAELRASTSEIVAEYEEQIRALSDRRTQRVGTLG